jgi:hypothetical protein
MTMEDQAFYTVVALSAAAPVLATFGAGMLGSTIGPGSASAPAAAVGPVGPSYLYLMIQINPTTGKPQCSPVNFTVLQGEVVVTMIDYDAPVAWAGCTCNVTGTVGDSELVNGSTNNDLSSANVVHTYSTPALGLNVLSPGNSTVVFTAHFNQTGAFDWFCEDPCGADGITGAPMGTGGYVQDARTVAP